tara:strand:+ start:6358 stop:7491 length:1134 start_codon:yes stop_codon:yes gene_type:complete
VKKVLIFIDWYIPAYKAGGPIISIKNIIEHLSTKFDFYIVTSNLDIDNLEVVDESDLNKWILKNGYSIRYLNKRNQNFSSYKQIVDNLNPTIVYLNSFFSFKFSILPILVSRKNKSISKIILAPRGMLGKGAMKIKWLKKFLFIKIMNFINFYSNINWHASTSNESIEIQNLFGVNSNIFVAQNLSGFKYLKFKAHKVKDGFLKVLFVSRISEKKNLLFLIESINLCVNKNQINLTIIGFQQDKPYLKLCLDLLDKYQISYEFLGFVPHNQLSSYYLSSDIFCLPTLHENYGHVILEALSHGLPIIISKNTPWRDLEVKKVGFDLPLLSSSFSSKIDYFFSLDDSSFSTYSENTINFYREINPINKLVIDNINLFSQ